MKKEIMTSANLRASKEGRSTSLKNSHKASKGVITHAGNVYKTCKQQSRLFSNFKPTTQIQNETILTQEELEMNFEGMI